MAAGIHVAAIFLLLAHEDAVHLPHGARAPIKVSLIPHSTESRLAMKPTPPAGRNAPAPIRAPNKPAAARAIDPSHTSNAPPSPLAEARTATLPPSGSPINMDDILRNVRRDAGAIDREMRQAAPNRNPSWAPHSPQSRFSQAVEAAGVQRSLTTEIIMLAGGRKMTKVTGPNGTYCVEMESNSAVDGLDHIQHGVRTKTMTCPR